MFAHLPKQEINTFLREIKIKNNLTCSHGTALHRRHVHVIYTVVHRKCGSLRLTVYLSNFNLFYNFCVILIANKHCIHWQ